MTIEALKLITHRVEGPLGAVIGTVWSCQPNAPSHDIDEDAI